MEAVRRELVFTARPGRADAARPVTLAEAGLRERADLQEWIREHPEMLGDGVRIITYEFDRWVSGAGTHGDRLDLLGLDEDGRLVLAELKRDGAPDTVEMQAIKYAAFASRFRPDTLAAWHGAYLRRTVDPAVTDEDALAQLDEHCGGLDLERLKSPRIVLVAGSFPEPVTAAVVWLCSQGVDITLIEIGAYQCATDLVITVSQLWPLPDLEDFTVRPIGPTIQNVPVGRRGARATNAVAILVESGAIADGTELRLVPSGNDATTIAAWVAAAPSRGRAIWRAGEKGRTLEWTVDGSRYSASGLAELIAREATGQEASLAGPQWWALEDGTTLAELAGFGSNRRDWSTLHKLLGNLVTGEWTTYGDLATAIGSHPIAVGQHIARCTNATTPGVSSVPTAAPAPTSPGPTRATLAHAVRHSRRKASSSRLAAPPIRPAASGPISCALACVTSTDRAWVE